MTTPILIDPPEEPESLYSLFFDEYGFLRQLDTDPQPEGDFSGASEDEDWGGR